MTSTTLVVSLHFGLSAFCTIPFLPAARSCARVLHRCFTHPESRGGRSAEKRSGAAAPVRRAMTRHARRLARRLASHDAGRSPLGAPPWRFWAPGAALPSPWAPAVLQRRAGAFGSVQRAPRTQVVVPGGRGPCLPRRTVTSRRRRTPLPAPPSGSSPETPLNERGCESCSMAPYRSQYINAYRIEKLFQRPHTAKTGVRVP
jgi:hypothetical protein